MITQVLICMTIFRLIVGTGVMVCRLIIVLIDSRIYVVFFVMMCSINIASWNATGIMSCASYASALLRRKDLYFLGICEHWIYPQNSSFLNTINNEYTGLAICDRALNVPSGRRVGKGGVALLWHRALNNFVTPLDIDSDRICGIQYRVNERLSIYILQVYTPCNNYTISVYREFIYYLHAVASTYSQNGLLILIGDFNAHLQGRKIIKNTNVSGRYLLEFMHNNNLLSINTLPTCVGASSSFLSYGGASSSF